MNKVQTDNSYLGHKIKLRLDSLPKKDLKVLSAYGGDNILWEKIVKKFEYKIDVDLIDVKQKNIIYMKGDNIKYLMSLNINKYDVIDLDAYGIPFKQLEVLFSKKYKIENIAFSPEYFGESKYYNEYDKDIRAWPFVIIGANKENFAVELIDLFEAQKAKALSLQQEINHTDKEIDRMVYELYGLTEEEIRIIEEH